MSNRRKALLDRYRDLIVVMLEPRFLAGFCYTQLTDIEQETNGLLAYDRQRKVDADMIAQLSRAVLMSVYGANLNLAGRARLSACGLASTQTKLRATQGQTAVPTRH
jgi:hypothetical protein